MLAKTILNSIKTPISQALIDFEISREEFKTIIVSKKEKYQKIKEDIRMMKSSDKLNKAKKFNKEKKKNKAKKLKQQIYE